jgi:hypothetical protein
MKYLIMAMLSLLANAAASSQTLVQIAADNTPAIVYLQIEDGKGGVIDHGTGFVVSGDYVVSAAHLKVDPTQKMFATIGVRSGIPLQMTLKDSDDTADVALWLLPQSPQTCRQSVTLSTASVSALDAALVMGFPGKNGLTPLPITIINTQGLYKANGYLEPGNSGGPVFNTSGKVVAIVQAGATPGTSNNDLVPIAPAINLIKKWGVHAAIDTPILCPGTRPADLLVQWNSVPNSYPPGHQQISCMCVPLVVVNTYPTINGVRVAPPGTQGEMVNLCTRPISILLADDTQVFAGGQPPPLPNPAPGRRFAVVDMEVNQIAYVDLSGSVFTNAACILK